MTKKKQKRLRLTDAALKKVFESAKIGQSVITEIAADLSQTEFDDQGGISYSQFRELVIKNDTVRQKLDTGFATGKNILLAMLFDKAVNEGDAKVAMWLLERVFGVTPKVEIDHKNSDGSLGMGLTEQQKEEMCRAYLEKNTLNS